MSPTAHVAGKAVPVFSGLVEAAAVKSTFRACVRRSICVWAAAVMTAKAARRILTIHPLQTHDTIEVVARPVPTTVETLCFQTPRKLIFVVTEKGLISFAARECRGAETASRRETDETLFSDISARTGKNATGKSQRSGG
jgi:Rad3-related DNA helicase